MNEAIRGIIGVTEQRAPAVLEAPRRVVTRRRRSSDVRSVSLSPQQLKSMPLDEYVQHMLDCGRYDVSPTTGEVYSFVSGQALRPTNPPNGYPSVGLSSGTGVQRPITVHRFIAIKVWGVDAIRGKHVGHRDGNRTHNVIANLWLPESVKEHSAFDRPDRTWAACACCGDPDGYASYETPDRITGRRFGIEGDICRRCYNRMKERDRRAKNWNPNARRDGQLRRRARERLIRELGLEADPEIEAMRDTLAWMNRHLEAQS